MTFEEFKQHFEIFSKIDTPEKLAICEKQYQDHLIRTEDANYFEPFESARSVSDNYQRDLNSILGFDKIANEQIHFLIQPSFEPEHLLSIARLENGYTSTVVTMDENYWCLYLDNSATTVKTKIFSARLSKELGDQIFQAIERSIINARKPRLRYGVLDGTVYKLSKIIDGTRTDVMKHSPERESKSGKIIESLLAIIDYTNGNKSSDAEIRGLMDL